MARIKTVTEADARTLFAAGRLSYKLHKGQKEIYDQFRAWEEHCFAVRQRGEVVQGMFPRVFVMDCSRRFGKDVLGIIIALENALRMPKGVFVYATAFARDLTEIVIPLFQQIVEDCPPSMRPVFKTAHQGQSAAIHFHNKAVLRLVGVDRNPDGLRGRWMDGCGISEAGFCDALRDVVVSVLIPQLQGRPKASIVLNSTPPVIPGHPYDDLFVPDSQKRGAYALRTIDDNPLLSVSEREEFVAAAGGRESETCRREYYCERIRSETRVVIPEFDESKHVKSSPLPEYAHCYTVLDPAISDLCAIGFAYYDFERAKLVVRGDWAKRNANTDEVVKVIRETEARLWKGLQYWDKDKFKDNPFQRYSDVDARLITDLNSIHKIQVSPVAKDDKLAQLHALRNAFARNQIEIHGDCETVIDHLTKAIWNKGRTSYERTELQGHFDQVDVLVYLWRTFNKTINPNPPAGVILTKDLPHMDDIHFKKEHLRTRRKVVDVVSKLFRRGQPTRVRNGWK